MPGTVDWAPEDTTQTILNDSSSCGCIINKLNDYERKINSANIPYSPFSTNSNAYAHGAASAAGLQTPKPPVWVPGWGTNLGVH